MTSRIALLALILAAPAAAQRKVIKVPRCAAADSIPALKQGRKAYIDRAFYAVDSSTTLVALPKDRMRWMARAKVDGKEWKGVVPVDLSIFLRNAEVSVANTQSVIRAAALIGDSAVDLGPALKGRVEVPPGFEKVAPLPLTVMVPPDALLGLVSATKPALRVGPQDIPIDKDMVEELAGLYATLLCGSER